MSKRQYIPEDVTIQLTKGYSTVVSGKDADLAKIKWCSHIGINGRIYARRTVYNGGKHYEWLHRVIAERVYGSLFIHGMDVDHIDNNALNNRRSNLRPATQTQNLYNSGIQKRQKEKGVLKGARFHKRDKLWTAAITIDGKQIHLGSFKSMEEAHEAYCNAAREYFGEFWREE